MTKPSVILALVYYRFSKPIFVYFSLYYLIYYGNNICIYISYYFKPCLNTHINQALGFNFVAISFPRFLNLMRSDIS